MNKNFFEYIFCYNALTDPVYMSTVLEHYNPRYFENKDITTLLDVATEFFQRRNTLPTLTEIRTMLKGDEQTESFKKVLLEFKTLDKEGNPEELYQNTEKFLRERAVFYSVLEVAEKASKDNDQIDTDAILDTFTRSCNISLIDDIGMEYFDKVDKFCVELTRPNNKIDTGFRWLNKMLDGGWEAEGRALYVFTGFTNVGKSIFLGHVTLAGVKANKTVLLLTLEMSEHMYAKRITSNLTKIGLNELKTNVDELKSKIVTFKDEHKDARLIIKEFPTKGMTVSHMVGYINKLIKKGIKPDMIVLDYLNLVKPSKVHSGSYDEIKTIAEHLRATTYMFKIPLITASQLGRGAAKKDEPGMESTSESIGLPFTADAQFGIWASKEDKANGLIYLGMQKNRFGPNTGVTPLKIDWRTLTLEELPESSTVVDGVDFEPPPSAIVFDEALNKFK